VAVKGIDHTHTKTKSPQTNGICDRFRRNVVGELYGLAIRKWI
jgi:hypothetical protein